MSDNDWQYTNPSMALPNLISAYDRFIPQKILSILGKNNVTELKLGDQVELNLTILFSDIRGFTTISESLTPKENFDFINGYFSQMDTLINVNNGIVDKYMGDAIMALFPTSADDALQCALLMLKQLQHYNALRERVGQQPIDIGIGLNTGISMLGIIGGMNRMEGTVISDAVNLSARLESLTKEYGVKLLISEHTLYSLQEAGRHHIRFVDRVLVKGKRQPQSVFEVFVHDPPELRDQKHANLTTFEEGVANYHYKNIAVSQKLFEQCLQTAPDDRPARCYWERCRDYQANGRHTAAVELSRQITWSSENNLGLTEIDKQHLELFTTSINLLESVQNQQGNIEGTMNFLEQYSLQHFATEIGYMRRTGYPFTDQHVRQHQKFVKLFMELKKEVIENRLAKTYLMFRIQIFIIDWIVNHTMKEDKHFGRFLKAKGIHFD